MTVPLALLAVIAVYSLLALCGLLGNLWVMWTVLSQLLGCSPVLPSRTVKPPVQSSAFIYLLMLSIVDLISFIPVPLLIYDIISIQWPFGVALCKLTFICEGINKTLSPMVLTALSVDRYIAVCRPTLIWMRQTKFSLLIVLLCILTSMLFIVPITVTANISVMKDARDTEFKKCNLEMQRSFDLAQAVGCYVVPLLLICSVYAAILAKLYRHTRISSVGRITSISLSRVVKCSVMVVAFYFICWTPYFTMQLIPLLMEDDEMVANITATAHEPETVEGMKAIEEDHFEFDGSQIFLMYMMHALPYAQSAFNWLFYAFLNRNLRNSGQRNHGVRSTASTFIADANSTASQNGQSIWKNLQQVTSHLKAAGADTGQLLLRNSPFRSKSRKHYRSAMCLDSITANDCLVPTSLPGVERSSALDVASDQGRSPSRSSSFATTQALNEQSTNSSVEWL